MIAASLLLSACVANRTTIQSSWADAEYAGPPLDRVAVVALFPTRADSLAFEREAAESLAANGVATVAAHELLSPAATQDRDEIAVRDQLAATDVDGILLFRLISVDERSEYQLPTPYLLNGSPDRATCAPSPSTPLGSSHAWFARPANDSASSLGYWTEHSVLVAETALFDRRTDRLLWTAKSETLDESHFERTTDSIVRTVARRLLAMDLIAPSAARDQTGGG